MIYHTIHYTIDLVIETSVIALSGVDRGFDPGQVKQKTMKLVFVVSITKSMV
jgi:hypothetical protein